MPNRAYLSAVGLALVAVAATYSIWSTVPAHAAGTALLPSDDGNANSPFDFFVQRCLSGGPDFEKTSQLAITQRWPRMTRQALAALAPVSDSDTAAGWVISDNTGPFKVLIVFKGHSDEGIVNGCTAGFHQVDTAAFEKALRARMGFDPQEEESGSQRIYKKFYNDNPEELVTLSVPVAATGPDQVIASVMAVTKTAQ